MRLVFDDVFDAMLTDAQRRGALFAISSVFCRDYQDIGLIKPAGSAYPYSAICRFSRLEEYLISVENGHTIRNTNDPRRALAEYWRSLELRAARVREFWGAVKRSALWLMLAVAFLMYYLLSKLDQALVILR
jgi:hypothetical protein